MSIDQNVKASPLPEHAALMGPSHKFRASPSATALDAMRLLVAAASAIAVSIAMTMLAADMTAITPAETTARVVPPVDADKLPARTAIAALSFRTFNVRRASGLATWLNIATCWPPQSASNGS